MVEDKGDKLGRSVDSMVLKGAFALDKWEGRLKGGGLVDMLEGFVGRMKGEHWEWVVGCDSVARDELCQEVYEEVEGGG